MPEMQPWHIQCGTEDEVNHPRGIHLRAGVEVLHWQAFVCVQGWSWWQCRSMQGYLSSKDGKGEDDLEELVEAAAQLRRRHLTAA